MRDNQDLISSNSEAKVTSILDIRRIEELSINARPSLKQIHYDGWVLRFAGGYTRCSNSVNPLYPGDLDVRRKIRHCESVYRAAGLPTIFKIMAAAQPAGIRDALSAVGYREQARTSVQSFDLSLLPSDSAGPSSISVRGWDYPSDEWLWAFVQFALVAQQQEPLLRTILGNIAPRARFAAVNDAEGICACGMAVLEDDWLGLFDIVTRPECRRRGFGRHVANALLDWGLANGSARAYLQVMLDNVAARSLFAGIGFRELYQCVYLVEWDYSLV